MPIRRLLEHNDAFSPEEVQVLLGVFDDTLRALKSHRSRKTAHNDGRQAHHRVRQGGRARSRPIARPGIENSPPSINGNTPRSLASHRERRMASTSAVANSAAKIAATNT